MENDLSFRDSYSDVYEVIDYDFDHDVVEYDQQEIIEQFLQTTRAYLELD